ncbi:hypothetical protein KKC17_02065 [Patescibacteria group bacterium]|nr:hypothetical protein [Patescibacteria group bacterium]
MAQTGLNIELFQKPMRWYLDVAELPFVFLSLIIILTYTGSFWLDWSYVRMVFPLVLIYQLVAAVVNAYLSLVQPANLKQTAVICLLTAVGGALVSAVAALIRFWYPWLFFNLIAEPIWSGLLAIIVGVLAFGFFHLPKFARTKELPDNDDQSQI